MPLGNIGKDKANFSLRDLSAKLVCIISTEYILGENHSHKTKPSPAEQSDKMSLFWDICKLFSSRIFFQTSLG